MAEKFLTSRSRTLYFAGGCFWGVQAYFAKMPWVDKTVTGYANGNDQTSVGGAVEVNYGNIAELGFAETVEVTWNAQALSLETLVERFFEIIDATVLNRQGPDRGVQYRTGIYYQLNSSKSSASAFTEADLTKLSSVFEKIRSGYVSQNRDFYVELAPLTNFYPAENYHQDYLDKNPQGYCHISAQKINHLWPLIDARLYPIPGQSEIQSMVETGQITRDQFDITQNADTEPPFSGIYDQEYRPGIYVDVISGEPLFISSDKFNSGCGWPSFSRPIDADLLVELPDSSIPGRFRTEIRSSNSNTHLGHVFNDGPAELTGLRYCINSASLRFIPRERLEDEGYGYLVKLLDE